MKYIKDNLALKLFSVCLALLLWLIVFNVSNPEQREGESQRRIAYSASGCFFGGK